MAMNSHLVFVSLENWDEIWRRNQFICAELARRHPDRKILFVAPPRDYSHAIRKWKWDDIVTYTDWSPKGLPNVHVFRPVKLLPNSIAIGRTLNAFLVRRQIIKKIRELQLTPFNLWINDHSLSYLLKGLAEEATVYDITDDWVSFEQPARLANRIAAQDAVLCENCSAVIVCSEHLQKIKLPLLSEASRLHLIPNGVDADHYASVCDRSIPVPATAQKWPQPIYGYVGTIHADRVDLALIEAVANKLSCGCIVLVGPNFLTEDATQRLRATGRVHFTGAVPYTDVPSYMRAFDVCITPHRVTPFTESLNPIKLWEYLAAGKPIVTTNVAGFRDFPEIVYIANDRESFLAALNRATKEQPEFEMRRKAEARRHSWTSRVDEIEKVLSGLKSIQ